MTEKQEKPKVVEDYFNEIFAEISKMKSEFGAVIKEDRKNVQENRKQIDIITTSVNEINSAITAANSAREAPGPSKKGRGLKLGAGAQGLISMITDLGKAFLANPTKFLGESTPQDSMYKQHKKLMDKAYVKNIENSIELSNLTVEKMRNEVKRSARAGWNL